MDFDTASLSSSAQASEHQDGYGGSAERQPKPQAGRPRSDDEDEPPDQERRRDEDRDDEGERHLASVVGPLRFLSHVLIVMAQRPLLPLVACRWLGGQQSGAGPPVWWSVMFENLGGRRP